MKDHLSRDAEAGDPYACLALAYFMQTGKELDQDIPESVYWFEQAASLGCARAHWELYKLYMDGEYVERDVVLAASHLTESAELGNVDAQKMLAHESFYGEIVPKSPERTFAWYRRAAEQGDSLAKFAVGYMFSHGIGVSRSDTEAEMWYSSAGITGHADLFMEIGMSYEYGLNGVNHNEVEAARWYKYGVDMGHEKCILCWRSVLKSLGGAKRELLEDRMRRLSNTESQREIDERALDIQEADSFLEAGDEKRSYEFYVRAAELGSPEAMFAVAMMHHQGIGVKRDDIGAIKLLSRAADAGSEDAQFYLARTYESNRFPTDESEIVKLYSDAAYNGFLAAYYYLSKYVEHPEVYTRRIHSRR